MTIALSNDIKNAMLDVFETAISSPELRFYSGTPPASCSDSPTGTLLSTITLPSDWMLPASNGQKALNGVWADFEADASGTVGYFRIYDEYGVCHLQGTVTDMNGDGDMKVDSTNFIAGQYIRVLTFTLGIG